MNNATKLKLTKIVLETNKGKKIELSIDEARRLYNQLHKLFGTKINFTPSFPTPSHIPTIIDPYRPFDQTRYRLNKPSCGALDVRF